MKNFLLVALGGGLGASFRYFAQGFIQNYANNLFPYGTMIVNIFGCLAIGFLMSFFEYEFTATPELRIFLTTGLLGGFTTYSSFSYESIMMLKEGNYYNGIIYIAGTLFLCLFSTFVGLKLGKLF